MPLELRQFYEFGPFRLSAEEPLLFRDDVSLALTPKVLQTLLLLVQNHGRLLKREELMQKLWPDTFVEESNLTSNISILRKALGDDWQNANRFIETVPKRGYRFIAPVAERGFGLAGSGLAESTPAPGATPASVPADSTVAALGQTHAQSPPLRTSNAPGPESRSARREVASRQWFRLAYALVFIAALAGYILVRPLPTPIVHQTAQLTNDGQGKGDLVETDGLRLFFTEESATETALKWLSVNGGESATLPTSLRGFEVLDISRDRSSLLLGASAGGEREHSLWLRPLPAGSLRRLGEILGHGARWSPDGRSIAYGNGFGLFVANGDGSAPRRMATLPGGASWIRWSPDGRRLRFTVSKAGGATVTNSLWDISAEGKDLHEVLPGWNDPPGECCGSWMPDGNYFIFGSGKGGKGNIWVIREKGAGLHWRSREPMQLTNLPQNSGEPLPSIDGKRIFFIGQTPRGELWHYSPSENQFVPFLAGIAAQWVAYSPDGRSIAYVKASDETLWRMKRDGTEQRQLTFLPMRVQGIAWSPNGETIAINARTPQSLFKNYLVAAFSGQELKECWLGHREREGIPTWSPDGRKIAFGDVPEVFGHGTRENLVHILDLATGELEDLPHSEGFWTARWSPDGRYIAAIKDDDPDPQLQRLFLYDRESGVWRPLDADHVNNPTWSHDGEYIYYDGEGGDDGIFRVRIPDGKSERVSNLNPTERWNMEWSGLTPDDSPLILGDTGKEEIYAIDVDWP